MGGRGVKINRGLEIFVKFNKRGCQNKLNRGVGISNYLLTSVTNLYKFYLSKVRNITAVE